MAIRILGVDPGLRATGIALIEVEDVAHVRSGRIILCETIRPRGQGYRRVVEIADAVAERIVYSPDILVVEKMQVYGYSSVSDDLVNLAILSGAIVGRVPHEELFLPTPTQWKGQVPKDIHHQRLLKRWPGAKGSKDALDALGLATYGADNAGTL